MTMQAEDERLGQIAYEAYAANTGGKSLVNGDDLPMWGELGDAYKTAWIASARAVIANTIETIEAEDDDSAAEAGDPAR